MKTDAELKRDILDELSWDPSVNATAIGVIVQDGVVTLTGHLATYSEKHAAERAVLRVSGVKALAVELDVRLASSHNRTDAELVAAVQHALEWSAVVPRHCIQPKAEKGWITLSGQVEWEYQSGAAERTVRDLIGVVGVSNLIKVKPHVSPIDIQKCIQDALTRQAIREAKHLVILAEGSRLTLRGKVHSWAERQAVLGAAWAAPGVSSVVNEMIVEI